MKNIFITAFFLLFIFYIYNNTGQCNYCRDEYYNNPTSQGMLSQDKLQTASSIGADNIDWSKLDNDEYTKAIMLLQRRSEIPTIKNLPVFV